LTVFGRDNHDQNLAVFGLFGSSQNLVKFNRVGPDLDLGESALTQIWPYLVETA